MAFDGRRRGHFGAHQMRATALALAALKIAVRSRGTSLAGRELIGVHGQAHAAAGLAPVGACRLEYLVQALGLGVALHHLRAGDDEHADVLGDLIALEIMSRRSQVLDAAVGAAADEYGVYFDVLDAHAGFKAHILERDLDVLGVVAGRLVGIGDDTGHVGDHAGAGAPGDLGGYLRGIDDELAVEFGPGVRGKRFPVGEGLVEGRALGSVATVSFSDVRERRFIRSDHARPGTRLDAHIAHRHAAFHGKRPHGFAVVLQHITRRAGRADHADQFEYHVLGGDRRFDAALELDLECFGLLLQEALRGQHMLDLRGPDAQRESPESAVRRGMRVAADDGGAGKRKPQVRTDDVNDALLVAGDVEQRDVEILAIGAQRLDLCLGDRVLDIEAVLGGDIVVHRGKGEVRPADLTSGEAKPLKGLRAGDLMHELAVDIKECGAVVQPGGHMRVPDLFEQSLCHKLDIIAQLQRREIGRRSFFGLSIQTLKS